MLGACWRYLHIWHIPSVDLLCVDRGSVFGIQAVLYTEIVFVSVFQMAAVCAGGKCEVYSSEKLEGILDV